MSDPSDAPPQIQSIRRSATLPSKLNPRLQRPKGSFKPSQNDLFYHPAAKVVHFAPRALAPIPSSTSPSDFDYPVDTVETLPWRSPTERTVAFAPLRLENVHGLTVFLKCGSVVHAILKNSQCWCVDGESTFVLRIRPLTYYRIELPNETEEDQESVAAMKTALPKILRYEVTPCPFKRGFTVAIPEKAKAPRRKKAWRPKGRRESAPVFSGYTEEKMPAREEIPTDFLSAGEETDGNATDDSGFTKGSSSTILETIPDEHETSVPPMIPETVDVPRRSVAETQRSFQTLLARFEDSPEQPGEPDVALSSSVESFHSFEHSLPLLPESETHSKVQSPAPPDDHEPAQSQSCDIESSSADRTIPEVEVPAETTPSVVCRDCPSPASQVSPKTVFRELEFKPVPGALPDDDMAIESPAGPVVTTESSNPNLSTMSVEFRRRSKASREREVSPMPPSSTLTLAHPAKSDAASIIRNTCTLVLIPPIQLLIVLIHIAARIVIGPALNSAMDDLNRKFECEVTDPHQAVDDYDLPLAPDCPRKRTGSEELRKLDPWDLD